MTTHPTETSEHGDERDVETGGPSRGDGVGRTVRKLSRNGSIAAVAGGTLLARALRSPRRASRAVVQGAAGAALVALGVHQWRRHRNSSGSGDGLAVQIEDSEAAVSDEAAVSSEATAHAERSDVVHQDETNPRGTSDEPEVETKTGPDEGSVQFTAEGASEPRAEPALGDDAPEDPRLDDADDVGDGADADGTDADGADGPGDGADAASADDGAVEVDLSEASMADEASEATGPAPEQAQPASTEETEPEPTPDEDASHVDSDVPDGPDGETGAATDADGEQASGVSGSDEPGSDESAADGDES